MSRGRVGPRTFTVVAILSILLAGVFGIGAGGAAAAVLDGAGATDGTAAKPIRPVRAEPADAAGAQTFRSCSIAAAASQPGALDFHGLVVDSESGEVLFDRQADVANPTASTMKLLTSAAALTTLGPDTRLTTRIVQGAEPGEIVVVPGGDFTLSSLPAGSPTYYDGATAHVADLAAQAKQALGGGTITRVVVDTSLYSGPEWQPSWNDADRTDGYISWISPFTIDGDRATPQSLVSPRSQQPSERAASALATALGVPVSAVTIGGTAPEGAAVLAEVQSQPVSELIRYALTDSDNTTAENLARLVAIERGAGGAFESIQAGTTQALGELGLDTTGLVLADGSGLSRDNRVPSSFMVALLELVRADVDGLAIMLPYLPASGETGTLDDRFLPGTTVVPPGAIDAKTGWIEEVYGLAGYMTLESGRTLTFAFYVVGPVSLANRDVLDSIASQAYGCGEELADW
ncbi:D-alanyl-D-alanine carboxypeptidase/D-alanyl-D-alanine-endopeptidase (penicillin-binding protein 4) [Pseudoclavibacter chungangensis]|uniref:D-alanyl-D-alanine carboxypeptidase/D-alanyl-D-alanine endopeptidase n=1 Tax=Pseudoclavibacter chungangensis TaxID=587635 RepID=UPI0015C99FFF|nr:D-alanyl-D-alanine carboxypeptidase/D-alanyl-D-alanine-endopeptidase [Pseudoclavibacter chungangensis]NYJ67754.1 D-alanyl-D-alanine carboxypeptidase/D-alanyl-D-alanine-endopeptidase (penicillin-binding protein 4) [Pseudoclavibacter chungangensis]